MDNETPEKPAGDEPKKDAKPAKSAPVRDAKQAKKEQDEFLKSLKEAYRLGGLSAAMMELSKKHEVLR